MTELEIYVMAVGEKLNFQLDRRTPLNLLADEIVSMVGQKERCEINIENETLIFYSKKRHTIFNGKKTLEELDISSGETLYLI
ncbi:MAG: hypothetical protein LUH08_03940 [Ruminococcus sp.]|nr:hypothetical protein [Ruminococcus sp.]